MSLTEPEWIGTTPDEPEWIGEAYCDNCNNTADCIHGYELLCVECAVDLYPQLLTIVDPDCKEYDVNWDIYTDEGELAGFTAEWKDCGAVFEMRISIESLS